MSRPTVLAFVVVALAALAPACAVHAPPEAASAPIPLTGKVAVVHGKQFLQYGVALHVDAPPEAVWALLTDAKGYPAWNSTIVSIEGEIVAGGEIALRSTVDPKRTFTLEVSRFEPHRTLVWEDGNKAFRGVRTFTLTPAGGGTDFSMTEALSGWMEPMIEGKLPDFGPSFEAFAADLEAAAERAATASAEP